MKLECEPKLKLEREPKLNLECELELKFNCVTLKLCPFFSEQYNLSLQSF